MLGQGLLLYVDGMQCSSNGKQHSESDILIASTSFIDPTMLATLPLPSHLPQTAFRTGLRRCMAPGLANWGREWRMRLCMLREKEESGRKGGQGEVGKIGKRKEKHRAMQFYITKQSKPVPSCKRPTPTGNISHYTRPYIYIHVYHIILTGIHSWSPPGCAPAPVPVPRHSLRSCRSIW